VIFLTSLVSHKINLQGVYVGKANKISEHPILAGLVVVLLTPFLTVFSGNVLLGWKFLGNLFVGILSWFASQNSCPNWLLALMALLSLYSIILLLINPQPSKEKQKKEWQKYTYDIFLGVLWKWRFNRDSIEITNLVCFCSNPDCEMQLVLRKNAYLTFPGYFYKFSCEYCGQSGEIEKSSYPEIISLVTRLIQRNIKKIDKGTIIEEIRSSPNPK